MNHKYFTYEEINTFHCNRLIKRCTSIQAKPFLLKDSNLQLAQHAINIIVLYIYIYYIYVFFYFTSDTPESRRLVMKIQ